MKAKDLLKYVTKEEFGSGIGPYVRVYLEDLKYERQEIIAGFSNPGKSPKKFTRDQFVTETLKRNPWINTKMSRILYGD